MATWMSQPLMAGNGPQNYLVVYDPCNPTNIAVAHYYQEKRGIPEVNMVAYDFPKSADGLCLKQSITDAECYTFIIALRNYITTHQLTHINGVVLAGETPLNVNQSSGGLGGSITTALWYAPNITAVSDITSQICTGDRLGYNNGAYNASSATHEIRSDLVFRSQHCWLSTHVGFPGTQGLRPSEIFDLLDRSKDADGTFEEGTIYWPINGDIRSATREYETRTTEEWDSIGLANYVFGYSAPPYGSGKIFGGVTNGQYVARNKTGAPGSSPVNQRAVQGMVCGFSMPMVPNTNNRYTKGALAEHVTSFGGMIGKGLFRGYEDVGGQMGLTEWLRAGACGSSGTVVEPRAYASKFPHARLHTHYYKGATLAEAFIQAVQNPSQLLVAGDPLCQPYA